MINKIITAFIAVMLLASFTEVQASSLSYWQRYAQEKYPEYNYSRYSRPTFRTTNRRTSSAKSSNAYRYTTTKNTRKTTTASNRYTYSRSPKLINTSGVVATIRSTAPEKYVYKITNDPVDLFMIGLRNGESTSRSTYKEAISVRQMKFQIVDNQGLASNLSDLALVVDGQDFVFTRNGFLTLKFGNLRLAAGESLELPIKVKVDDPKVFPRISGSFRVKLVEMKAYREISQSSVPLKINGSTISDHIVFNPSIGNQATTGEAQFTSQTVYGRALSSGEKAFVLTTNLYASGDDFILEKLTVRNTFGNNVDSQISQVNLWDLKSNRRLDSRKFVGGKATFKLSGSSRISIPRNGKISLGIEVVVRDFLPSNYTENRLSLEINNSDIVLYSYGAGRNVPDSSKNIDFDPQTFTIVSGGAPSNGGVSFSSVQPELVPTGNLTEVARFKIGNSGGGDFSIGRISIEAILNGLEYPGGLSTDDVDLKMVYNGNVISNNLFNVSSASGNKLVFDANSEVYIDRGQTREFSLLLKLRNIGSTSESDSVSVRLLGDGGLGKGSLATIRAGNYNFIWSDHSGRPHTLSSNDWLSGFLLGGLPTNFFVNRRD